MHLEIKKYYFLLILLSLSTIGTKVNTLFSKADQTALSKELIHFNETNSVYISSSYSHDTVVLKNNNLLVHQRKTDNRPILLLEDVCILHPRVIINAYLRDHIISMFNDQSNHCCFLI